MPRAPLALICLLSTLVAACGGGGGGGAPAPAPPPPGPPPPPDPTIAASLRPISALVFCPNGRAKRAAAASANRFDSTAVTLGIDHWHNVAPAEWAPDDDRFEGAMRTGAVVAGDFNGDCWPDLVFASGAKAAGQLVRYDNDGGTVFVRRDLDLALTSNVIAGLGTADLDGDYRPDLMIGSLLPGPAEIHLGTAAGDFAPTQSIAMARSAFGFAFADFSGDSRLDAIAAHWDRTALAGTAAFALRNTGIGATPLAAADASVGTTQAALPQDFHLAPGFADLDGDSRPELLVSADRTSSVVLRNVAGSFAIVADGTLIGTENAAGSAIADFDNDGRWDWFVAGVTQPNDGRPWPWGSTGNQLFWGQDANPWLGAADPAAGIGDAGWATGVCAQDFNNDGLVDLFVENGFGYAPPGVLPLLDDPAVANEMNMLLGDRQFTTARLFINQGNRTFVDETLAWGISEMTGGRGVACLDYDRDGDVDVAVAQNSRPAVFHENRHSAADGNGFVAVRLSSIAPNTFGVGARISVEAGGLTQQRQVAANSSYLGQDALELHFGLGAATAIDRITVDWPGGPSTEYTNLPINRFYSLLDPRMISYTSSPRQGEIASAFAAAQVFAANNPTVMPDDGMAVLGMTQRVYGLSLPYSPADALIAREQEYLFVGDENSAAAIRVYLGLVLPNQILDPADFARLFGFDLVTMRAVYCHQYPLDDAWVSGLTSLSNGGRYDTTHALLTLIWAFDNDCVLPATFDHAIVDTVVRDVYAIAEAETVVTDLRVEATALLAAIGRVDLIRARWLEELLDAQLPDGSWKAHPTDAQASGHTTAIALLLLAQLADGGRVATGFVPQAWDQ